MSVFKNCGVADIQLIYDVIIYRQDERIKENAAMDRFYFSVYATDTKQGEKTKKRIIRFGFHYSLIVDFVAIIQDTELNLEYIL